VGLHDRGRADFILCTFRDCSETQQIEPTGGGDRLLTR
jgi:hypothetical protein